MEWMIDCRNLSLQARNQAAPLRGKSISQLQLSSPAARDEELELSWMVAFRLRCFLLLSLHSINKVEWNWKRIEEEWPCSSINNQKIFELLIGVSCGGRKEINQMEHSAFIEENAAPLIDFSSLYFTLLSIIHSTQSFSFKKNGLRPITPSCCLQRVNWDELKEKERKTSEGSCKLL